MLAIQKTSAAFSKAAKIPSYSSELVGLAAMSAINMRYVTVAYQDGDTIPVGMYVIAEQPSGTSKSALMKMFTKKISTNYDFYQDVEKKRIAEINANAESKRERIDEYEKCPLFISNATPEAAECVLTKTNGYFSGLSDEAALLKIMCGLVYGDKDKEPSLDLLLNGFNGAHYNVQRVSREGFNGTADVSFATFAQRGTIDSLLKTTGTSGLIERFLYVSEPDLIGTRDFTDNYRLSDEFRAATERHSMAIDMIAQTNPLTMDKDDRIAYTLSSNSWNKINLMRNNIERQLKKTITNNTIYGVASKIDIQIMKIAANAYHYERAYNGNAIDSTIIPDTCIDYAINIALNNMYDLNGLVSKNISDLKHFKKMCLSVLTPVQAPVPVPVNAPVQTPVNAPVQTPVNAPVPVPRGKRFAGLVSLR